MKGTIITIKGLQLLAKLAASGEVLVFSRAAVGTGKIPKGKSPEDMEELVNYQTDGSISSVAATGNKATVIFQVSSIGVTQAFTIMEAGLYATDPDDGEILYSYLDMSDAPQRIYEEGSEIAKFFEATMAVIIGSVEKVSAYIDTGSLVTQEKFSEELDKKVDKVDGKGLSANDYTDAEKSVVSRLQAVITVTLTAAGWTGSVAPYVQTVSAPGITEDMNPVLVRSLADGVPAATQAAYNKAFAIVSAGTGKTGNGTVTFKAYKKPAADINVGLKGV